MKFKHSVLLVFLLLAIDQFIKIYIKTHFTIGESVSVAGSWFQLSFIENEGMAMGMKFGGSWGKKLLTIFRLVASIWGFFFVNKLIKQGAKTGLIFCASLILAGAIGNLIDCMFYGEIFNEAYHAPAKFVAFGTGYGAFLEGRVVDMFYFPIFSTTWPNWVPMVGGTPLEFFKYIFNFADFCISTGVIALLVFQKKLLGKQLF